MLGIGNLRSAVTHFRLPSRLVARCGRVVALGALTTLIVSCGGGGSSPPPPASVSGTITGLTGTGMTLQLNHANNLAVAPGATTFSFPPMPAGTNFTVSVSQQPLAPPQTCTVLNPAGTISATMSAISVECTNPTEELIVTAGANSTAFFVEPATGRLYPSGVYFTLSGDTGFITDPAGKFLFTASSSGVYVYTVSPSTGALASVTGSPFPIGEGANGMVVDPTGRFLYVGGMYGYRIDQESGALSLIPGSPFAGPAGGYFPGAAFCGPYCLASPSVLYFPVWNVADVFGLYGFSIDGTTGALTLNNSVNGVAGGSAIAGNGVIDPSYKFMYLADPMYGSIYTYAINGTTGALTPVGGGLPTPGSFITLDPSGAFAYANGEGDTLMYSRDPNTGILTPLSPSSVAGSGTPMMFDLLGKFVYVEDISNGIGSFSGYTFNPTTGALTPIPGGPFTAPHLGGFAIMRIP